MAVTGNDWEEKASKASANGNGRPVTAEQKALINGSGYLVWQFPNELGSPRFPHYVMFFINENQKATSGTSLTNSADNGTPRAAGQSSTASDSGEKLGTAVGAFNAGFKRTSSAIALYMPPNIQTSYNQSYVEGDANFLGNAIMGAMDNIAQESGVVDKTLAGLRSIVGGAEAAARKSMSTAGNLALSGDDAAINGALTGKVDNPRTESMFKSTQLRTHQFQFQFIPETEAESRVVHDIISLFKVNMHPEMQTKEAGNQSSYGLTGSYLITPNHFDVEFYDNSGSRNQMVHRIAPSVLESMEVNYSGSGQWLAFKGTGNPYHITLSLTFKEIKALTRASVMEGY